MKWHKIFPFLFADVEAVVESTERQKQRFKELEELLAQRRVLATQDMSKVDLLEAVKQLQIEVLDRKIHDLIYD